VNDVKSEVDLGLSEVEYIFGRGYWALGPNHKKVSVALEFFVEARLKSESFESLIGFLGFLVQKLG